MRGAIRPHGVVVS